MDVRGLLSAVIILVIILISSSVSRCHRCAFGTLVARCRSGASIIAYDTRAFSNGVRS